MKGNFPVFADELYFNLPSIFVHCLGKGFLILSAVMRGFQAGM